MPTALNHSIAMSQSPRLRRIENRHDTGRRLGQLVYLALHQYAHWRYVCIMKKSVSHDVLCGNVFLKYKYIGNYLARDLSRSSRRSLILSHYGFVRNRIQALAVIGLSSDGIGLWDHTSEGNSAQIILGVSKLAPMEGEWQIQY